MDHDDIEVVDNDGDEDWEDVDSEEEQDIERFLQKEKNRIKPNFDSTLKWHNSVIHAVQIIPTGYHSYRTQEKVRWTDCRTIVQFQVPSDQAQHNLLYFEITLTAVPARGLPIVGIGLSPFGYRDAMTGWYDGSIGYHSDDGFVFNNRSYESSDNLIAKFGLNDTVGLLWDLREGAVSFTWNGKPKRTFRNQNFKRLYQKKYYPCVTTNRNISFKVNFGEDPKNPFEWKEFRQYYLAFASFRNNLRRLATGQKYTDININVQN
ncbi:SPRY domain-containing protein [Acrasis kona]|uniref:SPRY domain-containing protein n=1 Tax=Acrasis kona TaxID=1008807 RepID=A0AAW2ZPR0_9EUKA